MHVLDATAIIARKKVENAVTTPEVVEEIKDEDSKLYLDVSGIKVEKVKEKFVKEVLEVAKKTGDIHKLSEADISVLAKALEYKATIITDDYAVQNVAKALKLKFEPVIHSGIRKSFKWIKVCRGCGRKIESDICPVCGSEAKLRRVRK
ncbi:PIN domain-containing protein [Ferroglobus sp.]|uniref:NOB1 family endonuclease n=1 Tax=Ferroglobus sp. TaxID=2614230 RepID=UPI0025BADDE7|nr:PIN domain-containing protein [Ferroglobus sp.]